MIGAFARPGRRLGLSEEERETPLARHFHPVVPPLAPHVLDALAGPRPAPLFPRWSAIVPWLRVRGARVEDGYTTSATTAQLMLRTHLPAVTPAMIDWWFAWHSDEPLRYKLWHPAAHVHACWGRRPPDARSCVGGVSIVDEYLGDTLGRFSIAFLDPRSLGFDEADLRDATVIAARVGLADAPIEAGHLLHHVQRERDGSTMRSFFWLGGEHAGARGAGTLGDALVRAASPLVRPTREDARALLLHCAEEMSHLATFLPALHREHHGPS